MHSACHRAILADLPLPHYDKGITNLPPLGPRQKSHKRHPLACAKHHYTQAQGT